MARRSSIWLRRFENCRSTPAGTPSISAMPLRTGRQATPSRSVSCVAQLGLEQEPGRPQRRVHPGAVERAPPPVRPAGRVGDEHVPVELRVAGPARAMPERRRDEPVSRPRARHRCGRVGSRRRCPPTRRARGRPRSRRRRRSAPTGPGGARRAPTPTSGPRT